MIEWLSLPLALAGVALIPKRKLSDEKKIEQIFKNRKVGIAKKDDFKHPKFIPQPSTDTCNLA